METIIPIVILFSLFLIGVANLDVPILIPGWITFILPIITGIVLLFFLTRRVNAAHFGQSRNTIFKICLVALILRWLFTIVFTQYMIHATGSILYSTADEVQYETRALKFTQEPVVTGSPIGFVYILSGFYSLFGCSPLLAKLANCVLGALTCLYVYLIASKIHSPRSGYLAGMICAFYPYFIRWSAFLQKDVCLGFLVSLMAWETIKEKSLFHKWITIIISGFLLLYVRITVGAIVFPLIVIYITIIHRDKLRYILTIVASGALVFIVFGVFHSTGLYSTKILNMVVDYYDYIPLSITPGSADVQRVSPIGALRFILTNPLIVLYNLAHIWLAPLPWKISNINNVPNSFILATGWIMLMIMIPAIISGSRHLIRLRQKEAILLISIIVALSIIHSIMLHSWRYRSEFMPLGIVVASIRFTYQKSPPFERVMVVLFLLTVVIFSLVYSIART